MSTRPALIVAAAFAPFLTVVAGCGDTYACGGVTGPRVLDGALETRESALHARMRDEVDRQVARPIVGDAGHSDAGHDDVRTALEPIVSAWSKGSMSAEVLLADGARCKGTLPCVVLSSWAAPNVYIRWELPQSPGPYELARLHAEVCETVSVDNVLCSSLEGWLQVRSVVAPCADGSCGHIDADFVLQTPTANDAAGPTAAGTGSVYVDMYAKEQTCHRSPVGGIPLGGLR